MDISPLVSLLLRCQNYGNDAKIMNQKFYPIKTLYFYMERRKVSLNTTIKRAAKLWGKRCPKKVLNTCGPACATSLLFSTFFWLFQGLFLTASPVPVKMVVVVHNSANSSLGIMNRVRGRGVMMRGFFHRVRGRTGTQKSDLSMLLSTNFAILHEKGMLLSEFKWKKL